MSLHIFRTNAPLPSRTRTPLIIMMKERAIRIDMFKK